MVMKLFSKSLSLLLSTCNKNETLEIITALNGEYPGVHGMFAKPIEYINDIIVIPLSFIYQLSLRRLFTNELKIAKFIFICNVA